MRNKSLKSDTVRIRAATQFEWFNTLFGLDIDLGCYIATKIYSFEVCKCVSTSAFRITHKFQMSFGLLKPMKNGHINEIRFMQKLHRIFFLFRFLFPKNVCKRKMVDILSALFGKYMIKYRCNIFRVWYLFINCCCCCLRISNGPTDVWKSVMRSRYITGCDKDLHAKCIMNTAEKYICTWCTYTFA